MNILLAVALGSLVVLLSIVIWSIRRHRDPKLRIECSSPIDELIPSLAELTLSTAVPGNSVEVLENGAFSTCCWREFKRLKSRCISKPFFGRKGCSAGAG
jgi:cardiolipin synthase A/B